MFAVRNAQEHAGENIYHHHQTVSLGTCDRHQCIDQMRVGNGSTFFIHSPVRRDLFVLRTKV